MKIKNQDMKNANKWQGYYLEDTDCADCLYYKGKRRGCTLTACSCEDIKNDAIEKGRINRKRGL
jgi:hypothetical protein